MEDEPPLETETYMSTHAETELPTSFLAHFQSEIPPYNPITKTLIESFAGVSF